MSSDRTAEIWSTRLQRELLALSESQSSEASTEDAPEGDKNAVPILPPFVSMSDYTMDIEKGICKVNFQVEVEQKIAKKDEKVGDNEEKSDDNPSSDNNSSDNTDPPSEDKQENPDNTTDDQTSDETPVVKSPSHIIITLDASMETNADGRAQPSPNTYPFQKPLCILKSGFSLLPAGSTASDGDPIEVDCDWTPSLHLTDAALNVSLKIRESVRKGDPFRKAEIVADTTNATATKKKESSLDATLKKWGVMGSSSSSSSSSRQRSSESSSRSPGDLTIGDVIDLGSEPYNVCAGMYSCKAIRRPEFVERAMAEAEERERVRRREGTAARDELFEDDDEIPSGIGNYMRLQAGGIKKVAGAGIVGAGSIFKSIVQQTKSVLEESFLMITDEFIIELRSSKFSIGSAIVVFINPISLLAKLKFRRQESISLFFKQAPDDPLIFMCPDSADAVTQIQIVLKRHGVRGKHTNAATQRSIQAALNIVVDIQAKERVLTDDPSVERVDEIMSLYRQAAEKFESAGDARHEEVMSHMHKFLAKPMTVAILDGSYKTQTRPNSSSVPQGEVLDATNDQLDDEDDDDEGKPSDVNLSNTTDDDDLPSDNDSDTSYSDTIKKTDDILEEAKRDMNNYGIDDDDDDDDLDNFLASNKKDGEVTKTGSHDHDAVAELDAMLSAADKELNDLIQS